jgi:hypothetical protein
MIKVSNKLFMMRYMEGHVRMDISDTICHNKI